MKERADERIGEVMAAVIGSSGLPRRLRVETAGCHAGVEAIASIPTRVRSRDDYVDLLGRFYQLHAGLESHLQDDDMDLNVARYRD